MLQPLDVKVLDVHGAAAVALEHLVTRTAGAATDDDHGIVVPPATTHRRQADEGNPTKALERAARGGAGRVASGWSWSPPNPARTHCVAECTALPFEARASRTAAS